MYKNEMREENDAQNPSWQTYKSILQASGEGKGDGSLHQAERHPTGA